MRAELDLRLTNYFVFQTTWLRRNFVVKSDLQEEANDEMLDDDKQLSDETLDAKKSLHHYAVPALSLLAELLAPVLDIIFQSDEKEKVTAGVPSMSFNYGGEFLFIPYQKLSQSTAVIILL